MKTINEIAGKKQKIGQKSSRAPVRIHEKLPPRLIPIGGHQLLRRLICLCPCRLTGDMNDTTVRFMPNLKTGFSDTIHEVDFLEIKKILRVHEANMLQHGSPHHETGTGHPVYFASVPQAFSFHI